MTYAVYKDSDWEAFAAAVHTFTDIDIGDQLIDIKFTDFVSTPQAGFHIWSLPGIAALNHVDFDSLTSSETSCTIDTAVNGLLAGIYTGVTPISMWPSDDLTTRYNEPTFLGSSFDWIAGDLEPTDGNPKTINFQPASNINSVSQFNSFSITPGLPTDRILLIALGSQGSFSNHTVPSACEVEISSHSVFPASVFSSPASQGRVSFWTTAEIPLSIADIPRRVSSRLLDFTQVD